MGKDSLCPAFCYILHTRTKIDRRLDILKIDRRLDILRSFPQTHCPQFSTLFCALGVDFCGQCFCFSLCYPTPSPHTHSSHKGALATCQTVCQTLHILISFNKAMLWSKYYHLHCTQKETEAKPPASRWQRASFNHYITLLYKSETCRRPGYGEGSFSRRLKGFLPQISTSSEMQYFRKRRKLALFWVFSLLNRKCSVRK